LFFSDNGGLCTVEGPHTPATINAPLREGKGYLYEGGIRGSISVASSPTIRGAFAFLKAEEDGRDACIFSSAPMSFETLLRPGSCEHLFDLSRGNGFDQVEVETGLLGASPVLLLSEASLRDQKYIAEARLLAYAAGHFIAVHTWQADVD